MNPNTPPAETRCVRKAAAELTAEKIRFANLLIESETITQLEAYEQVFGKQKLKLVTVRKRASKLWTNPVVQEYVQAVRAQAMEMESISLASLTHMLLDSFDIAKGKLDSTGMTNAVKGIASLHGLDKGENKKTDSVAELAKSLMALASNESLPSPGQIIEDAEFYAVE